MTQSSCCLDPHSPDEESEAQRGNAGLEATEPVNGGAGMQALSRSFSVPICNIRPKRLEGACLRRPRRSYGPRDRQVAAQANAWCITFNSWEEG